MGYSRKKSKHEGGGGLVEDMEFPARRDINEIRMWNSYPHLGLGLILWLTLITKEERL